MILQFIIFCKVNYIFEIQNKKSAGNNMRRFLQNDTLMRSEDGCSAAAKPGEAAAEHPSSSKNAAVIL